MGCVTAKPVDVGDSKRSAVEGNSSRRVATDHFPAYLQKVIDESKERRANQHLTANVVAEEFVGDIKEYYEISPNIVLGTGECGEVRVAVHKLTGVKYAIKTLKKVKKMPMKKLKRFRQEMNIMASIDHPNIIRLHECFETTREIYLILELCTGGELYNR